MYSKEFDIIQTYIDPDKSSELLEWIKHLKESKKSKFTLRTLKEDLNQISHQHYWKVENGASLQAFESKRFDSKILHLKY